MNLTTLYGAMRAALAVVAREYKLRAFDVRMLVALRERGGVGTSRDMQHELGSQSSDVRRSSLELRAAGLITADAGPGTTRPRRGTTARYSLTPAGESVADCVLALYRDQRREMGRSA